MLRLQIFVSFFFIHYYMEFYFQLMFLSSWYMIMEAIIITVFLNLFILWELHTQTQFIWLHPPLLCFLQLPNPLTHNFTFSSLFIYNLQTPIKTAPMHIDVNAISFSCLIALVSTLEQCYILMVIMNIIVCFLKLVFLEFSPVNMTVGWGLLHALHWVKKTFTY